MRPPFVPWRSPAAEVFNSILPPFLVKRILRNPSHAIGDRALGRKAGVFCWPFAGSCSQEMMMFSTMLILL